MAGSRITPLPIIVRRLSVLDVHDVTGRLRRVTVGGPELGAFERDGLSLPAFASKAFDDHVKLVFAPGGEIADALPVQLEHGIEWRPSEHRVTRDYTPIRVDVDAGTIAFDFALHSLRADGDPSGGGGPAESWALRARPGDDLWIVGPKSSTVVPSDAEWSLLAGDETAQPAVERFLIERPVPGPARIVLTVADESARRDLPLGPDDVLTWIVAPPGDREALASAVREVPPLPGAVYVWAAAESRSLLPIRKYVARELGVPKDHVDITGYWHLRHPERADAEAAESSETADGARASSTLVESPVTWFAVRAALRLGLLDRVDASSPSRVELAAALSIPSARMDPLIDVLLSCGVVDLEGDRIRLGDVGDSILTNEHVAERFDGSIAEQILALADLAESLPSGQSAWTRRTGVTYAQHVDAHAPNFAELVDESSGRVFLLPAIMQLSVFAGRDRIGFCGPGASVVADGLRAGTPGGAFETTIVHHGAGLDALRAAATTDHEYSDLPFVEGPSFDLFVAVDALGHRSDAEAREFLRSMHAAAPTVLVIESTSRDALGVGALDDSLIRLAAIGEPMLDAVRLAAAAEAAGWTVADSAPMGWGVDAVTLTSS